MNESVRVTVAKIYHFQHSSPLEVKSFRDVLVTELAKILSQEELLLLPKGYQRIGNIALLNLDPKIERYATVIGNIVKKKLPHIRTVCLRTGPVSGVYRLPSIRVIAGDPNTETVHKENGCLYKLDVGKVMFAKGNVYERGRIAQLVKKDEIIVDMFAGIGYFSLPIAVHAEPQHIYAIDANPDSIRFLRENVKLNKVEHKFTIYEGDCRNYANDLANIADRVIMGYFPGTAEFLETAFKIIKKEGGVIHYHDVYPKADIFDAPIETLRNHSQIAGYQLRTISHKRIVKSYAPGLVHVVIDAEFVPVNAQLNFQD